MTDPEVHLERTAAAMGSGDAAEFFNLLKIVGNAFAGMPPLYVSSIFGLPWTWIPALRHRYSEFHALDPWRPLQTLKFLVNVAIPSVPRRPPAYTPPMLNGWFWQPSLVLQRPDHNDSYTSHADETWFFINGVATNDALAQVNAANLADLFHRPIALLQNATCSLALDLLECAAGELSERSIECANVAFTPIYDALKDPSKKKVVVIAHSQGTIVIASVLAWLKQVHEHHAAKAARELFALPAWPAPRYYVLPPDGAIDPDDFDPIEPAEWQKLEIYCFANCAKEMEYAVPATETTPPAPWIESLGNEFDLVARLGMLASDECTTEEGIHIDGPRYRRAGAWGHLLGEHYLAPIDMCLRPNESRKRGGRRDTGAKDRYVLMADPHATGGEWPRLFDYVNGGMAPPLDEEWRRRAAAIAQPGDRPAPMPPDPQPAVATPLVEST